MTLVAGVDSSTQSCKVVVRDLETGALVRSGRAAHPDGTEVDPAAWWAALQEALAAAGGLDDVDGDLDRRPAARNGGAGCGGPRHPRRPALERHPLGASRPRPDRRGRRRRVRGARRRGSCRLLHRYQAALAAGCGTGQRRARRRRRASPRLADLASARLRPRGRERARSGPGGADHRPLRRERHRLLERRHGLVRPRPVRAGARAAGA